MRLGALALRAPRAGLALALAAPILPLGNVALGLALLYGAIALGWLALSWGDARSGLAFLAGPLLAPLGLIALVPLAVQPVKGPVRRGAQAVAAVAVAALVAGLRGSDLPFGQGAPGKLDVAGTESAVDAAIAARARRPGRPRARRPRSRRDCRRNPVRPRRRGGSRASARLRWQLPCSPCRPLPRCPSSSPFGSPASVSGFEPSIRVAAGGNT